MGIFGTNQDIISKLMIFMPFWMGLFLVILSRLEISEKQYRLFILLVVLLYSLGYLMQGNFRRYHSYYTARSSKYELDSGVRYKNIKVSAKNDAHFSFNNFSYGVSIEAEHIRDDIYKIYVAAGDRYDFHGVFDDNNYFINNGNEFALKQQTLNTIKNFDVHIGFIYYTQHAHDWSRESGICSICRKTLINNHLIDINLYDSGR